MSRLGVFERVILGLTLVAESATLAFCLIARPTPASALGPLLGPWYGYLFDHEHCTMARLVPAVSWGALVGLLLAGLGLFLSRHSSLRPLASGALGSMLLAWCALTVLSLVNSLE